VHSLVSFCNTRMPGQPLLGVLDPRGGQFRALRVPTELLGCAGVTGIVATDDFVFASLQTPRGAASAKSFGLAVFGRDDFDLRGYHPFEQALDSHSMCVQNDKLFVVSTGTDELLAFRLDGPNIGEPRVVWRPDPTEPLADVLHLNAVCDWKGEIFVAGFGRKTGPFWSSATEGFIFNVSTGQPIASGINQPHSLAVLDNSIVYCGSRDMGVSVLCSTTVWSLPGYTRGLCVDDAHIFVGSSAGRRRSTSTGIIENPSEPGEAEGRCAVTQLSRTDLTVKREFDLSAYGDEIYDLVPVADVAGWPTFSSHDLLASWGALMRRSADAKDREIVRLNALLVEQATWCTSVQEQADAKDREIGRVGALVDEQTRWAQSQAAEVARRDEIIRDLQAQVAHQTAWARTAAHDVASGTPRSLTCARS